MKKNLLLSSMLAVGVYSQFAYATPFGYQDLSNAPELYAAAVHETGDWQRLGASYGVNDGVSWSVDGGVHYDNAHITQGQVVDFKFVQYSHNIGGHISDPLRVWLDWNGDSQWSSDELIFSTKYNKAYNKDGYWVKATPDDPTPANENPWNGRHWVNGQTGDWVRLEYTLSLLVPANTTLGDTWLRARTTCDASLGGADWQRTWSDWSWDAKEGDINNLTPTDWLHQGEVEDYKLTITRKPVQVPEPSVLILLLSGLAGLAFRHRRQ